MATTLVTGATGNLGRAVVRRLLDGGLQVRVYARRPNPAFPADVAVYQGDIREGNGLREATEGVNTIIHCVSVYEDGFVTDQQGARHLIDAATANGAPHLIFISIAGIDHSPFPYFQAKLAVEHMVEGSGLPWSILRATQFHDYILSVLASFEDEQAETITIRAGSRFQPIAVGEVADALVALAQGEAAGRAPDVGGPEVLTLEAMAQTYIRVFHKQRAIRTHSLPGAYFDAFRSDDKLVPEHAVGRITWDQFLHQRAERDKGNIA